MQDSNHWYTAKQWCEKHHQEFYDRLKELSEEEQSKVLITQASILTLHGETYEGNFQAAESMINFWMVNLASEQEKELAVEILRDLRRRIHLSSKGEDGAE